MRVSSLKYFTSMHCLQKDLDIEQGVLDLEIATKGCGSNTKNIRLSNRTRDA